MRLCSLSGAYPHRLCGLLLLLGATVRPCAAQGAYNPYTPQLQPAYQPPIDVYIPPMAPLSPRINSECLALQSSFDAQDGKLSAEHQACLDALRSQTRQVDPNNLAICSVAACQGIHNQWQAAEHAKSSVAGMVSDCYNAVSAAAAQSAAQQQASTSPDQGPDPGPDQTPAQSTGTGSGPSNNSQAEADAAAMKAAQDERQMQQDALAARSAERQRQQDALSQQMDSASAQAAQEADDAKNQIARMENKLLRGPGGDSTGTNNAPPLPSGDDFASVPATGPPSGAGQTSNAAPPSAYAVTPSSPPNPGVSVIEFGKRTQSSTPPVPGPSYQYEDLNNPGTPSVITYQAAQEAQPLYIWSADDPTNPVKYCGNNANIPCEIDYPGKNGTAPVRPQFSRPAPVTNPSSSADCIAVQQNWQQLLDAATQTHQACLDHWSALKAPTSRIGESSPGSLCTYQACQEAHNSKERVAAEMQAAVSSCVQALPRTLP